jgi:hypothetical protein
MDIKVKEVTIEEEKSAQEIEADLLKKHEETVSEQAEAEQTEEAPVAQAEETVKEETPSSELSDEDVLSYIKNRYDKEINSVDDLFAQQESNDPLPEDVSAYFNYKKETGRGIEDFVALQKDYNSMEDDQVLANYYSSTEDGLDAIDIQDIIEDKFSFDEDIDEPKEIKKKKLAKKRELAKAKKFLNEQKDKYKIPLESSGSGLSEDVQEEINRYKSYIDESKNTQEQTKKRYDYFLQKTNEVFNDEFKGFEFEVGGNKVTFKPGDSKELKSLQSDVNNFVGKYMDKETGLMNDPKGYHRAMAAAMNPEKFAQFFYEQGVAAAVDNVSKKSKNIDMVRSAPQTVTKNGTTIRAISPQSMNGLRIKSKK